MVGNSKKKLKFTQLEIYHWNRNIDLKLKYFSQAYIYENLATQYGLKSY